MIGISAVRCALAAAAGGIRASYGQTHGTRESGADTDVGLQPSPRGWDRAATPSTGRPRKE